MMNDVKEKQENMSIEKIIEKYISMGYFILDEKYHEKWIEYILIRVSPNQNFRDLDAALELIQDFNTGKSYTDVKNKLDSMNLSLVDRIMAIDIVSEFSDKGSRFSEFIDEVIGNGS